MVEWKKLGEIANITIGEFVHRDKQNPKAKYPVYNGGTTYTGFYEYYNNTGNKIVISARGYAGFVNRVFDNYWAGNSSYSIDINNSKVLWHYVYYYLKNEQYNIMSMQQKGGGLAAISKKQVQELLIPIPSLSEQSRIVSILDTFTSSISNLKQQIEERRKQYEYERDLLLDLEGKEGVEMKKLGECVLFITDGDHQPPPKSSEGIPFVTISDIEKLSHTIDFSNTFFVPQEYYNSLKSDKKAKKGDVLYTVTGSFGIPVLIEDNREFCFQRHIALIRPNNTIALSRYIYHWLCSNYAKKQGEEKASGGAQKTVSLNSLRSFRFYYPPLQAQSRIVSILDTFEQSISNLEEQLAMREKQYEYYRNQLLTFEGEEERGKT